MSSSVSTNSANWTWNWKRNESDKSKLFINGSATQSQAPIKKQIYGASTTIKGIMKWAGNKDEVEDVFKRCISEDSIRDNKQKVAEMHDKFINLIMNQSLSELDRLIKANYVFNNSFGSTSREKFLEICFDENLLNKKLLTSLYVSVHTQARPYQYFSEIKMERIFQELNLPFTCFESQDPFKALADKIQIYRGLKTHPKDIDHCGFCWSLEKRIAKKFATCDGSASRYIINGWVDKNKIYGFVTSRDESEIITNSSNVTEKVIEKIND